MVCPEVLSGCQHSIYYIDIHSIDIPYQVIAGIVQSTSTQRLRLGHTPSLILDLEFDN